MTKRIALIAILGALLGPPAFALPACYPTQVGGSGQGLVSSPAASAGGWLVWWCPKGNDWALEGAVVAPGYQIIIPPVTGLQGTAVLDAYWAANVLLTCASPKIAAQCAEAATVAAATKPAPIGPPLYVVKPNGTATTRPLFPVTAGKRSFSSTGTALVGATCDCTVRLIEGSITYCGIGQALVTQCIPATP